jgi:TRAP-type C4-dicarboxylate transport system permease small subunit
MKKELLRERFSGKVKGISGFFIKIAGISLVCLMGLTIADVILRFFGRPIPGTYECVAFLGAIVLGLSVPLTSWTRGQIYVDFLILKFPKRVQDVFNIVTRCMVIILFLLIGWTLMKYGMILHKSGEVSLTLEMPYYPIVYVLGITCFIQCLVLFCDIFKILGGKYD